VAPWIETTVHSGRRAELASCEQPNEKSASVREISPERQ
jgi:hypothetical protein